MTRWTVVGWNGSPSSEAALRWAVAREESRTREIVLVRALDDTRVAAGHLVTADDVDVAQRAVVDRAAELARENPHLTVRTEVAHGGVEGVLAQFSAPGTLVVVGAPPADGTRRRLRRPVGERLASRAPQAVAVVPQAWRPRAGGRVVVGVDGTPSSQAALSWAAQEAGHDGVPLTALHVWVEPFVWDQVYVPGDELQAFVQHQHERLLEETIEAGLQDWPDLRVLRRVVTGRPQQVLVRETDDASLLVVGNHSHGPFLRTLLGSVSGSLVAHPPVPVVVVHPDPVVG